MSKKLQDIRQERTHRKILAATGFIDPLSSYGPYFHTSGFDIEYIVGIELGKILPKSADIPLFAALYGLSQEEFVKIINASWEGNDIKEQVERMVSLSIALEEAWNRSDHVAVNNAIADKSSVEDALYSKDVTILPDQENTNILHVYIYGEQWRDFDAKEWQWRDIEGIEV